MQPLARALGYLPDRDRLGLRAEVDGLTSEGEQRHVGVELLGECDPAPVG